MFDGLVPDLAPRLLIAIGGVAVAFLVLIAVLLFLRRRNSPLFVKGGRAREHRLLVMDAAAVDAKRRLVLIRRDDVEHLIMIGGPTDIVIETGIDGGKRTATAEKPVVAERSAGVQQPPAVPERPIPPEKPVAVAPQRPTVTATPDQPANQRRQAQDDDAALRQRRAERQAARAAAEAAQVKAAPVAAISAAGSVLYDDDDTAKTAAAKAPAVREAQPQPNAVAAETEKVLENARGRVLNIPAAQERTLTNEEAVRQLEEQLEAGKIEAARAEAARAEAARVEAARLEAERAATAKADAERAEAVRAEAARLEAVRLEAQKAEAARLEAERAARAQQEAERAEAERAEAARIEAEKAEAARVEAARVESERIAAARAEAMARFEAARRAQAEQRQASQTPPVAAQQPVVQQPLQPTIVEPFSIVEPPASTPEFEAEQVSEPAVEERVPEPETAALDDAGDKSQERLASDFERLLEAELEADGILDNYPAPNVAGERRETASAMPSVNPVQRDTLPITGAAPGVSIEQDMARRLGEISLNRKTDPV